MSFSVNMYFSTNLIRHITPVMAVLYTLRVNSGQWNSIRSVCDPTFRNKIGITLQFA